MSGDMGGGRPDRNGGPKRLPRARPRLLTRARVGWPPALRELKDLLYEVYLAAGTPSLDEISEDIAADVHEDLPGGPSRDTISRVISDRERAQQQADVVSVAKVLARRAAWDVADMARRVRELWVRAQMAQGVGRPIGELRDDLRLVLDRGLGIHPALEAQDARDRFGILPTYVPRDHDARLKTVVDAAVAGDSGITVLVGRSSTGKTRALWEAVRELPDGWRLLHPLTPTAPEAVLAALPDIAPRTVVWLNEAQYYLAPHPLGEQVAAGLRKLLTDPSRAPVLVLGTLWREHWDAATTDDQRPNVRALLNGHKIDVPKAFISAELAALGATADADPRLTQAAQHAEDAQVTQYLAGVPYLMDRYHAAEGATLALIHAAMDARRLGAGLHIPLAWLADAAPGYLTDTEYRALEDDWLPKALAYVTTPCNGIPGILTPVNVRGSHNQRNSRRPVAPNPQGPHYLLADYLDQHGRRHRAGTIPPIDFWTAAAHHAYPNDLTELGNAAWNRGLCRDAAQLHKNATTHGSPHAAISLINHLHTSHPSDPRPAQWAAAHAALDDPSDLAQLLEEMREAGADDQVAALLACDPAAHAALEDPSAVAWLLRMMREAGADDQVVVLAGRAAAQAALGNPLEVDVLLRVMLEAGAQEQVVVLAGRAAAHAAFYDPPWLAMLLEVMRGAGADDQVAALLARDPAAHAALEAPFAVAGLLKALREAGADDQVAALLARDPAAHAALEDPSAVASLLREMREAGAYDQVAALLARDPAAHAAPDNPYALTSLLEEMREAGADDQVAALAGRAAAHAALNNPSALIWLLKEMREARADDQVAALAGRAAAHAVLNNPSALARLLREMREAELDEQVTTLLARDAAVRAALDNAAQVATLREAGADDQVAAFLARDAAAHAALEDPSAVAGLLKEMREAGADGQVAALLARDPAAHAALEDPSAVAWLLRMMRVVGADDQVAALLARDPAAHAALDKQYGVAALLGTLQEAGADNQVTVLARRLPAAGHFGLFIKLGGNRERFRLGREPDGSAAPSWTWNDLD
ncbi:hypothetical protein [Streptomyces galbus]|uniref:Uncharacterized protein n=1 Tax=Streptomyces galbus TaxID=33898 RepID=A0A4U5WY00_STRGB|nr:hypothetical protein [Streptomyces galbus]TKT06541.1 hypothetical protein E4U92_26850 [Streptomyces galbus]GHD53939.1 hypothetical protein GCM10010335_67870 [Streptomyces galbus]